MIQRYQTRVKRRRYSILKAIWIYKLCPSRISNRIQALHTHNCFPRESDSSHELGNHMDFHALSIESRTVKETDIMRRHMIHTTVSLTKTKTFRGQRRGRGEGVANYVFYVPSRVGRVEGWQPFLSCNP